MKQLLTVILVIINFVMNAQLRDRPLQKDEEQRYVEFEGYFGKAFEYRNFYILNGKLQPTRMWVHFSDDIYATDSLDYLTKGKSTPSYYHGVYMKIGGMRKWGDSNGYGHMGYGNSQLIITKVFEVDTLRTRWKFIIDDILTNGYHNKDKVRLFLPQILKSNKDYHYVGRDENYTYELRIATKDNSTIDYNLQYREDGSVIREINGTKFINLFDLTCPIPYPEQEIYPTLASYTDWQGRGPSISFMKEKENGRQVIEFSVPSSDPYQPLVKFYEVKP